MCKVLIFGCIAAVILMTAAYGAPLTTKPTPAGKQELLRASITDLKELQHIENDYLDFYTPNDKQECKNTTLQCYLKELDVLIEDTKGDEETQTHLRNIKKNLNDFKVHDSSKVTCKECKTNEQKKFPEFRQELTSFLQSL
ncbi:IL15 protein, partial [Orthonyx spaldingii]|nr:IL15 protein [Orthonyx spaldingii]